MCLKKWVKFPLNGNFVQKFQNVVVMEKYKTAIYLLLFTIYQIINENEQNLYCY